MNKQVQKNVLTRQGYDEFVSRLQYLKSTGRADAANAIRIASEQGDLSENAEYDSAKENQALLEKEILEIENLLKNCEIIDVKDDNNITPGKIISLKNTSTNTSYKIKLVGNNESDPLSMKISVASPIGKELLKKKVGDTITVDAPHGETTYSIIDVSLEK